MESSKENCWIDVGVFILHPSAEFVLPTAAKISILPLKSNNQEYSSQPLIQTYSGILLRISS